MAEIRPSAMTLHDLVGLGDDALTDSRIPRALLVEATRKFIRREQANARRSEARRAERRAYGDQPDAIDQRVHRASIEASGTIEVVFSDILDVRVQAAGEGQTWGTATVDDHDAAADALERIGGTYVRTAAMHRRAIDVIVEAGARTLNDTSAGLA
jgi:hypothetical protein